jgi:basic membrane protein A
MQSTRKFYLILGILFVVHGLILALPSRRAEKASATAPTLKVGLVFDVGGRGDKSFNDAAYAGLERAQKELGIEARYLEPSEGSDREAALRLLASQGMDLLIGVGFIFTDDLTVLAREYPHIHFAGVDYVVPEDLGQIPANLAALSFSEEEGSFLVGALAALRSQTGTIGFIGGMDIPLIKRFEAGYVKGAKTARPDVHILVHYAGVTGTAFKDPAKGKELASTQYGQGADIIYHASGSTGLGVFEAARLYNKLAIGVDSDQHDEAPGFILTSMVKRVDNAVYRIIDDTIQKKFSSGVHRFGLAEGGVDYMYDARNQALTPAPIRAKVEALRQQLINKQITVPLGGKS